MAYVVESATQKTYVWPIQIARDPYGNVTARDKITTGRIAAVGADTENEYTIGTSQNGSFL